MKKKNFVLILLSIASLLTLCFWIFFTHQKVEDVKDWKEYKNIFAIAVPQDFNATKKERLQEKIKRAQGLFENKEDVAPFWRAMGDIYQYVGDYDRAILVYKESISIVKYDLSSTLNLATIYEKHMEDFSIAEEYYKKAISIHDENPPVYNKFAQFYEQKMKDISSAESVYLEGLKNTGNDQYMLTKTILFYLRIEKESEAKKYAKILFEKYPNDTRYQRDFGYLLD
ncbi:MAG: tetratricopeptide repeat protein [Candidatus Magasanikbacteria bacterium]|jgi:tetratricopeptide (TPR) repeat protein|nr:tetratricopeptide repeat protein [Candidatus Magasanikbacteria bacterium]MBT5262799.1 tetratricopeptide repeat protein [Candidatus Magasanikbacteria bacterium]MBT5820346.1 tetratricopeptide repeat protein [Candidatus Magasanikbacteria bacterium]MBT6294096.1 tetratricopeptide repeat protein [Candidatus Magasanikbacteria bacterium]